jgi:hypothetical protein
MMATLGVGQVRKRTLSLWIVPVHGFLKCEASLEKSVEKCRILSNSVVSPLRAHSSHPMRELGWCPPEEVGGVTGYQEFLEVIFDPTHQEFEHLVGWASGPVHAEGFDLKAANATLGKMRWPVRHRR